MRHEEDAPARRYFCELLSSSRSRTSSDTKRSARCSLVIVTAEREELLEHDALGCCIDGKSQSTPAAPACSSSERCEVRNLCAGL